MWSELQFAALFGKHVASDATAVPASTALQMATINSARALNLDGVTGSLSPGKAADIVCVTLTGPGQIPVLNPISQLVYSTSREQVSDVWVAGEHLVADGRLTRMDLASLVEATEAWAARIAVQ
jgi:5-methylthioadenosine/S-adenosylhomocysteine deaminase